MTTKPIPYPANTKAKGWRFELDLEQVIQSDTWALARPEARPWLLMLWITAWQQVPCGSMPAGDDLIIARLGITPKEFAKFRSVLLRGWWAAEDGRLYHDTIAARVVDMLERKSSERDRKAKYRAEQEAKRLAAESARNPQMSHGTNTGQDGDKWDNEQMSHGTDDTGTGTGTGTGTSISKELHGINTHTACVSPGEICKALKAIGIADVNPGHADLLMLLEAGADQAEFEGAARTALKSAKGFAYTLGIVKRSRESAAKTLQNIHQGAMPTQASQPNRQVALEQRNRKVADEWAAQGATHDAE